MLELIEKQRQLIKEIEEHYGKSINEVANDKILSKDSYFVERDKEYDRLQELIDTECF